VNFNSSKQKMTLIEYNTLIWIIVLNTQKQNQGTCKYTPHALKGICPIFLSAIYQLFIKFVPNKLLIAHKSRLLFNYNADSIRD